MSLLVVLGLPLPEPLRDLHTFASELAEDLDWSYRIALDVIGHVHKRTENRYNERVIECAYPIGCIVRVMQLARNSNEPSKLDAQYSGFCEVLNVHAALLIMREIATQRVFTANHNAIRRSTITLPAVSQLHAARVGSFPSILRAAPPPPSHAPLRQAQAHLKPTLHVTPIAPPPPATRLQHSRIRDDKRLPLQPPCSERIRSPFLFLICKPERLLQLDVAHFHSTSTLSPSANCLNSKSWVHTSIRPLASSPAPSEFSLDKSPQPQRESSSSSA